MSFNATFVEPAVGFLGQAQDYFWSLSTAQRALLVFVNLPIITIALNVLSQLVRCILTIRIAPCSKIGCRCSGTSLNHL